MFGLTQQPEKEYFSRFQATSLHQELINHLQLDVSIIELQQDLHAVYTYVCEAMKATHPKGFIFFFTLLERHATPSALCLTYLGSILELFTFFFNLVYHHNIVRFPL